MQLASLDRQVIAAQFKLIGILVGSDEVEPHTVAHLQVHLVGNDLRDKDVSICFGQRAFFEVLAEEGVGCHFVLSLDHDGKKIIVGLQDSRLRGVALHACDSADPTYGIEQSVVYADRHSLISLVVCHGVNLQMAAKSYCFFANLFLESNDNGDR